VDDGVTGQRRRVRVGDAAAQAGKALHGDAVVVGGSGSDRHHDRELSVEFV
jgi:hypothetical protein